MKEKKFVSVVVLTYNSSKTIEKCLQSLENQSNKNFEILIVDDDSTDNTLELIKPYFNELKIKVLKNGAHNISRGRNIGIKNSKFRYVAFLDSDAYADKNWIGEILKSFNEDKKLSLVGGESRPVFNNKFSYALALNYETIMKLTRRGIWAIEGCNFAIDKKLLFKIYFNENFIHCDDVEYSSRIKNHGYKINYNPLMKVDHEPRSTPKKFLFQQYKYGIWEVLFTFYSKKHFRLLALFPSVLILISILGVAFNPILFFTLPFVSLLETLFVLVYNKKAKLNLFFHLYLGWLIKNLGWGTGVMIGLFEVLFKSQRYKKLLGKLEGVCK